MCPNYTAIVLGVLAVLLFIWIVFWGQQDCPCERANQVRLTSSVDSGLWSEYYVDTHWKPKCRGRKYNAMIQSDAANADVPTDVSPETAADEPGYVPQTLAEEENAQLQAPN
jgi:hypothetical protein